MRNRNGGLVKEIGVGAAAGLGGTVLIQAMKLASEKWFPRTVPPVRQDPGEFMVEKIEGALPVRTQTKIPEKVEISVAHALALGYGMTFGSLYGAAHPKTQRTIRDGSMLGIATWAAGYLGWLPALHLIPPVYKQKPRQVFPNLLAHLLYGIATVASFTCIQRRLHRS